MSDDNVVDFTGPSVLPRSVDRVLKKAAKHKLTEIVIIGYDSDENVYFDASEADGPSVLWCLEIARHMLMTNAIEDRDESE